MGQTKYQGAVDEHGRWNGVIWFDAPSYDIPLRVKKPTIWFVDSMSDLFHERVGLNWQMRVWEVMRQTRRHTYQILTKRAGEMARKAALLADIYGVLPNVWLGVSVENQAAADERIPHLLRTPAAIRFLSCEPLLGPVDLEQWLMPTNWALVNGEAEAELGEPEIDWVITGGESGPGARPMHPDWARSLRDQCVEAGIPFFFKQFGEWQYGCQYYECDDDVREAHLNRPHKLFANNLCSEWQGDYTKPRFDGQPPPNTEIWHRVGKKRAGRLLDGREWNEMPEAANG
ncbi:MAG: hypothetical protein FOGNACKC_02258 [Anaerolineae bacterium]|nr:hypothetical protein [Anaerolineae bacterium]